MGNLPATACLLLQEAPVWEITGAEFSKSEMHTADGISIRFPRMTRIRDDKDWKSATNLHQLKVWMLGRGAVKRLRHKGNETFVSNKQAFQENKKDCLLEHHHQFGGKVKDFNGNFTFK